MKQIQKTKDMVKMALLMAMNCVSAYIIIPVPFSLSPVSLQPMLVMLLAFMLKPKQVFFTMSAYLLMGLAGVPVFTGGASGPGKLFGPTGGYIIGFLFAAVLVSMLKGKYSFVRYALVSILVGVPVIYLLGMGQLMFVTGMGWQEAFLAGVLPFLPMEIVKCLGAAYIAKHLNAALKM